MRKHPGLDEFLISFGWMSITESLSNRSKNLKKRPTFEEIEHLRRLEKMNRAMREDALVSLKNQTTKTSAEYLT